MRSSAGSRLTSFSAWLAGTSGSASPCRMWTGQCVSIGPVSTRFCRAVLDQRASCRCSARRNSPTAPRSSPFRPVALLLLPVSCGSISSVVKSGAGAISTSPAMRPPSPALRSSSTMRSAIQAPIDEPTRICARRREATEHGEAFAEPFRDRAVAERAAGFAMAGIVVPQEGAGPGAPPTRPAFRPWCRSCPSGSRRARRCRARGRHAADRDRLFRRHREVRLDFVMSSLLAGLLTQHAPRTSD